MAQQQEAKTDRLVGLIAHLKMNRRSGQLTVRRGEGLTTEEGMLLFLHGQVTRASVGRRSGSEALNWLSTWGQARYIFLPADTDGGTPLVFSSLPSSSPGRIVTSPNLPAARINTDRLESNHLLARVDEVPYTSMELNKATASIERAGLPRSHRRLFMLIDGHRTIAELVPLVGKKAEEIRNMLQDLEWLGVIQISNGPS
jgi:hypothetical protein